MPLERSPISPDTLASKTANRAWSRSFLRIGHGGAAGHAAANSLHSLRLALDMGVDVVEFDVRPCRDALVLQHDDSLSRFNRPQGSVSQCSLAELRALEPDPERQIATLAEALDLLKGRALINIDLKATGYEKAVQEMVGASGLTGDVIYSSVIASSLRRIWQTEPGAMIGLSYPEDRGDANSKPALQPLVMAVLAGMRLALPFRIRAMMAAAHANAVMLYHKVVSRAVIQTVQKTGGKVFTWTVDDWQRMQALRAMGVNGVTTNYPEIFGRTYP